MSSEPAIVVDNLAKRYRIGSQAAVGGMLREHLTETALRAFRRDAKPRTRGDAIWALDHVSFDVAQGEVLGVIGRNGAGKTTLLKLLSGITDPTDGEARIRGRVGALLEVGSGFHGELTGRENVYLNGAILGMRRREIEGKFDEIVAFAEVERFIDTPVKRYSTGMYLRLAFAVAAHLEPEILIVDEVLAVGDAAFQRKCLGKMGEVSGEGRTVLLVSHNMSAITSLATRCLWLDAGQVRALGAPGETVGKYLSEGHVSDQPGFADVRDPALRVGVSKVTHEEILFESIRLQNAESVTTGIFFEREPMRLTPRLRASAPAESYEVVISISTLTGVLVFVLTSGTMDVPIEPGEVVEVPVEIPTLPLRPGRYLVDLYVLTSLAQDFLPGVLEFEVSGARDGGGADPRYLRDTESLITVDQVWGAPRSAADRDDLSVGIPLRDG
jgi:lipopolysaccharide transport system ATP-binding protein